MGDAPRLLSAAYQFDEGGETTVDVLVQKYGGTSLQTLDSVRQAALRIAAARRRGSSVVVVVSARGSRTDDLLRLAADVGAAAPSRELDQLLAVGESESAAVMALALNGLGVPAISLTGHQAGIQTTDRRGDALISRIGAARVRAALDGGEVAVVTGFQGVDRAGDITTLGRGGSDTTAVALAARLRASACEIYTDVDGVFSADPRILPAARCLAWVQPGVMAEMAFAGARILHTRCIELAAMEGVEVRVRNASSQAPGTTVVDRQDNRPLETRRAVVAVTHDTDVARVLVHCRDIRRDLAPDVFEVLAAQGTVVDLVARSGPYENEFRMGFTIRRGQADSVRARAARADGQLRRGCAFRRGRRQGLGRRDGSAQPSRVHGQAHGGARRGRDSDELDLHLPDAAVRDRAAGTHHPCRRDPAPRVPPRPA